MTPTQGERITRLETIFEEIIKPMATDIKQIRTAVNGGGVRTRKDDGPKQKYMRYGLYISVVGLIASNVATCAWVSRNVATVLETIPK